MQKAQTIQKKSKSNNTSPFQKRGDGAAFIQPKLNIGKSDDKFEKEADQMADTITSRKTDPSAPFFTPAPHIQKLPTDLQKQEEKKLQETVSTPSESFVARKKTEDEEKQLMKKEEVIEELQKKEVDEKIEENNFLQKNNEPNVDEEPLSVQAKPDGTVGGSSSIQSGLNKSKGGGSPLPGKVKSQMESGFGTDFRNVRLHTDSNAVQMSRNIGAQAFTHGNDIYFNEGKYQPESDSGKHLLAHELTHTMQQGATLQKNRVQKQEGEDVVEFSLQDGTTINTLTKEMILPMLSLPKFKERNADRFPLNMQLREGDRPKTLQRIQWKNELRPTVTSRVDEIISDAQKEYNYGNGNSVFLFFKPIEESPLRVFGNRESLIETFLIPFWNRDAVPTSFQVDHIYEDQMGGYDDIYNYELLEATANGSAGPMIGAEIRSRIKQAIEKVRDDSVQAPSFEAQFTYGTSKQEITKIKNDFEITFTEREFVKTVNGNPEYYWDVLSAIDNEQIDILRVMSPAEISAEGLSGSNPDKLLIYPSGTGGIPFDILWGESRPTNIYVSLESLGINLFSQSRVKLLGVLYNPAGSLTGESVGILRVQAFKSDENSLLEVAGNTTFDWQIDYIPGLEFGGTLNKESVAGTIRNSLRLPGLSPIELLEIAIDPVKGIIASGKVFPTVPVISDADIDIIVEGDSVRLRKLIDTSEFHIPNPFIISDSSLEIFVGSEGLSIEGRVNFAITNVGEGYIGAAASTGGRFELEGAFNFDSELFDPAEISVVYKDDSWTIGGEIGIPEGKVRGVKNALIIASYTENSFTATGNAELDVPGIERGTMTVNYGEEGFSIGGNFDLSSDIPGIKGGSVEARVSKEEGAEAYDLFASGTAQPDIPGIDTSLSVTYENGALTIEGSAAYSRGMLSGNVAVGATNRAVDAEGLPTGEPGDRIRVYGGGDLTLQLTPWLRATAGVQFLPNGEIEIVGRIALPDTVDVFERKELRRNLFSIPTIEIPLFAIPLGPRSIGLVAQIDGGLTFVAGFGPGQLRDVYAEVTYNPDREDETLIHGHALFAIPADAGLTLSASLGLGVSVGIASLTGGIELAGTLGLEGEAAAEADLSWNPTTGIVLDAEGSITVNPKFIFDVNAFARATLGVGWFSISETWRHNLASFSWGPDIQFGILFPVHYEESQPFDIGFNDIEVIYPDLKVVDMAIGMARDIKDQIF